MAWIISGRARSTRLVAAGPGFRAAPDPLIATHSYFHPWVAAAGPLRSQGFQHIYAQHLLEYGKPDGREGRIALPLAGDDAKAKATMMQYRKRAVDERGLPLPQRLLSRAIQGGSRR